MPGWTFSQSSLKISLNLRCLSLSGFAPVDYVQGLSRVLDGSGIKLDKLALALALLTNEDDDHDARDDSDLKVGTSLVSLHLNNMDLEYSSVRGFLSSLRPHTLHSLSVDACQSEDWSDLCLVAEHLRQHVRSLRLGYYVRVPYDGELGDLFPCLESFIFNACGELDKPSYDYPVGFGLPDTLRELHVRGTNFAILRYLLDELKQGPSRLPHLRLLEVDMRTPAQCRNKEYDPESDVEWEDKALDTFVVDNILDDVAELLDRLEARGMATGPGNLRQEWQTGGFLPVPATQMVRPSSTA